MLKFIILSDIHLVKEGALSHGLDTYERFIQSIDFVNENHADADFIICAGDLADHGEVEAYQRFKTAIAGLKGKLYLTLGNHDHRPTFLAEFGAEMASETGNLDHVIDLKGHRVIILDSSDPTLSDGSGHIEPAQLAWLQTKLDEVPDVPVIVVLHHNITKLQVQTDFIILDNPAAFADVLLSHKQIRQVISGHVHMTTAGCYRGLPFSTLAGGHYNIDPVLQSKSGSISSTLVPRREGPGQLAVVLSDDEATVVHMENFLDRHLVLAKDLFKWD